jgi:hypothetical protein
VVAATRPDGSGSCQICTRRELDTAKVSGVAAVTLGPATLSVDSVTDVLLEQICESKRD